MESLGDKIKLVLGVLALACFLWFVYAVRGILGPFVLAFVLAYILEPLVDRLEGRGMGRTLSIVFIFFALLGGVGYGLVELGGKLSSEVQSLSQSLLLQESVERRLKVVNEADSLVQLEGEWAAAVGEAPFTLIEPNLPLSLSPGEETELLLRFEPQSQNPVQTRLFLWNGDEDARFRLYVRGNAGEDSREAVRDFWAERAESSVRVGALLYSVQGIDFGPAGESILKRAGEYLKGVQPLIKTYLGQDFNLVGLVRDHGRTFVQTLIGSTSDLLDGVLSGITYLVIVPFVTFFFLREGGNILHGLIEWVPNAYFELVLNLIHQVNGQIGGYIRGQLLAVSVVATLAVVGLTLINVQYALVIGVLAGLANMIPYLGPLIGIVTAAVVAVASGGGLALISKVVVVFLIIQLIDNILIQPTIIAKSVNLHPLVVLFAVMVGNQLGGGIVGMLFAVPVAGILKVSIQTVYQGFRSYRAR